MTTNFDKERSQAFSRGAADITTERLHQLSYEGYDAAHDDLHAGGEIAVVAAELTLTHTGVSVDLPLLCQDPWGLIAKHVDVRRRLVIAGALIAAEIDRLDRKAGAS